MKNPVATYRVQFNKGFDFNRAARESVYLKELGVSHLYASPCLKAVSGSVHGYDVTDFTQVNPELGGIEAYERLCDVLQVAGMGQILDIVPNHMAADPKENPLWRDVLAFGEASPHADFFDINWQAPDVKIRQKVLAPILGDHYDNCLKRGELQFKLRETKICLTYYEHELPLSPAATNKIREMGKIREKDQKPSASVSVGEQTNPEPTESQTRLKAVLDDINADPDRIHDICELCHFRLAWWRTAPDDINFRRFFDINELVCLRMEKDAVFHAVHEIPLKWFARKMIDGFRIDHPDGLCDPKAYLMQLAQNAPDAWIVVEKILETDEKLPLDWPAAGTTGYDFLYHVNGLFVDPAGEAPLTKLYKEIAGPVTEFAEVVRQKKHQVLEKSFPGAIERLARLLTDIRFRHRPYRDLIQKDLYDAVKEVIACFPVYRTYARPDFDLSDPLDPAGYGENDIIDAIDAIDATDKQRIKQAVSMARHHQPEIDQRAWDLIENCLTLTLAGTRESESEFVIRFQELAGPAMAKGLEDTTFYCFNRLVSLNEVGGNPGIFGVPVAEFHAHCQYIQKHSPLTLCATATHDTKRGEDTRLRINLLSEISEKWADTVKQWMAMTAKYQTEHKNQDLPDANTRYLYFQTLVGAWPIEQARMTDYMEKAVKEAKVHTSWTQPDETYEKILADFVQKSLSDQVFTESVEVFVSELKWPAWISSLSQTLIKCTAPGVPDIYQGTELWDLSLVDPDNRRPVDFSERRRLLARLKGRTGPEILSELHTGLPKLFVILKALEVRRRFPEAFGKNGTYRAIDLKGEKAAHGVAFIRGESCITIAPRLLIGLDGDWRKTVVRLPGHTWENALTGEKWESGDVRLASLTSAFPVALLVKI